MMFTVNPWGSGLWFASCGPRSVGILFGDRVKAQEWCDRTNASCDLDRRKNAALGWAIENGVPDAEVDAALKSPDHVGLLDFEARMADAPHVVEG